ncbi:META domain-containing protein [uncultured Pontibacter sp.]|uniref:META domain-containing protein n=1 Tax=uncultured Pontibacter sp. TaxID=453356 RepID=UPI00260198D2|nr:META domain-containing protein [uncultured Pontibacter sp.]
MNKMLRLSFLTILPFLLAACGYVREKNQQFGEGDTVLQGSYWMLLSLQDQQFKDNPETRTAYLRFEEGSDDLKGFTGCNRLMGKYRLSNGSIQLTNLSSSRAMCPIIEQENMLMDVLAKTDTYRISGEVLTLYAQNEAVATFRAGAEPTIPDTR